MKLYRLIALICIHIAALCILGHATIPHCHSGENELCVILNHNHCNDKTCDKNHQQDCQDQSGGCMLTQIILQHHSSVDDILPDASDAGITLLLLDIPFDLLKIDFPNTSVRLIPNDEISHYLSHVSPTLGLRAPPFI